MASFPDETHVLARLVAWGEAHPSIRALVLTSSRARADESVDALSDYDPVSYTHLTLPTTPYV